MWYDRFRASKLTSIGNKSYFQCVESYKYDKNNSDLLARAIQLRPQNLSYPNSWLVVVKVFVCMCVCLSVCLCDNGKHYRLIHCWCYSVRVTMLILLSLFCYVDIMLLISLCWYHSVDITLLISLCWYYYFDFFLNICGWAPLTFQWMMDV